MLKMHLDAKEWVEEEHSRKNDSEWIKKSDADDDDNFDDEDYEAAPDWDDDDDDDDDKEPTPDPDETTPDDDDPDDSAQKDLDSIVDFVNRLRGGDTEYLIEQAVHDLRDDDYLQERAKQFLEKHSPSKVY